MWALKAPAVPLCRRPQAARRWRSCWPAAGGRARPRPCTSATMFCWCWSSWERGSRPLYTGGLGSLATSGRMRRTGQGMYVKGGGREPPTGCRLGALACAVQPASLVSDRLTGRQTVGCRALSPDAIVIEGGRAVGRVLVDLSAGQVRSVQALQRLHRPLAESVRALAAVQQDVQLPALHAADQHPTRCTPAPNNLPPCSACLPSRAVPTPRATQRQSYTLAAAAAPSQPQTSTAWAPRSCSCCRVGLLSKLGGGCCSQETWWHCAAAMGVNTCGMAALPEWVLSNSTCGLAARSTQTLVSHWLTV